MEVEVIEACFCLVVRPAEVDEATACRSRPRVLLVFLLFFLVLLLVLLVFLSSVQSSNPI